MMDPQFYVIPTSLIISNTTNFTIILNEPKITVDLYNFSLLVDSTSLVCGDASGITFCGERIINIWDIDNNVFIDTSTSTLLSLNSTS